MRARLLGIVLSLVGLLLIGLGVPLARSVAGSEQQRLFLDRLTDTSRFASLAQRPLIDNRPALLTTELRRYDDLYDIAVLVFDRDHRMVGASREDAPTQAPGVAAAVDAALAGRQPELGALLLPWEDAPLVLAEPVRVDAEVRGAVVTVSPTDRSRARILGWWALVGLGGLVALGLALLAALPVVRWVLRPVRRLDDATGALLGAVVAGRPVEPVGIAAGPAELRQLGRSFDVMAANVAEVLAAQRAFVADASHQLRNPLTALRLRLGNLEGEVSPAARADQAAALAEAARLSQILDDLLTTARAEASTVEPVAVDVDEVVAQRVATWQVAARARGVDLVLAGEPGGRVLAPPRGVETVLDALLDNALKFTPEPPPEPALVEVRVRRAAEQVWISVRDHGPGLDDEELARATDRFWRSRAHQNVPGSGLGLAIVRRIAERVGGSVTLDRPEDGGLRVTVTLPAA